MGQLNGKKLFDEPHVFDSVVYSDASEQGFGGYVVSAKHTLVCQGQWQTNERGKSSTWRELKAVHNMLLSIGHSLSGHKVQWHTDNQNIVRVIDRGSTKPDLQSLVEDIVYLCAENHVVVVLVWVPREGGSRTSWLITSANYRR